MRKGKRTITHRMDVRERDLGFEPTKLGTREDVLGKLPNEEVRERVEERKKPEAMRPMSGTPEHTSKGPETVRQPMKRRELKRKKMRENRRP